MPRRPAAAEIARIHSAGSADRHADGMSSSPPPYGGPPYGGALPPSSPGRSRPSRWWFAVGAGLLLAAVLLAVLTVVRAVGAFVEVDATLQPGQSATVELDGAQRLVWVDPARPAACSIVDPGTGQEVATTTPGATYTKSLDGQDWEGVAVFTPASGSVVVTCRAGGPLQIGPAPDVGGLRGVLIGVGLPVLLGLAGLLVLVVAGILTATRPARSPPWEPGQPGQPTT